jgi:AcrR family transcriptional regulator
MTITYHHGELKAQAIEIAIELIHQHGADALTLRAVAREADVSHAALYRHFADRHTLLDHVASRWLMTVVDKLSGTHSESETINTYVSNALQAKALYQLVFGIATTTAAPLTNQAVMALRDTAAISLAGSGLSPVEVRDRVIRMWSTMHGMLDLYWHGLIRAKSQKAAIDYIVRASLAM